MQHQYNTNTTVPGGDRFLDGAAGRQSVHGVGGHALPEWYQQGPVVASLWSSVRAVEYYRNGSEHVNAAVGADARTRSTMADLSKRLHAGWA